MMRNHKLEELIPDEDAEGFLVVWVCDCGRRGEARDQPGALSGWHEHSKERDFSWCRIVVGSAKEEAPAVDGG